MNDDDIPLGTPTKSSVEEVVDAGSRLRLLDTLPPVGEVLRSARLAKRRSAPFSTMVNELGLGLEPPQKKRKRPRIRPGGVSR